MSVIDKIREYMDTDDEADAKIDSRLDAIYTNANNDEKDTIDKVLIAICGWSYPKILDATKN